jgi:hypothetical protein
VLTREQVLAADFKGTAITLTVQSIEVPDRKAGSESKDEGVTRFGSHGVITNATRIQCSQNPDNRYLIWEKSANNSASMLLKPDFKFAVPNAYHTILQLIDNWNEMDAKCDVICLALRLLAWRL